MNMASPLSDTFLMNMIAPDERATASSFNAMLWNLPNAGSTVVGGQFLKNGNLALPFYLCGGLYIMSIVFFYTIFRRTRPSLGNEPAT
jgi:predicted MFS family arabinose efflux permease